MNELGVIEIVKQSHKNHEKWLLEDNKLNLWRFFEIYDKKAMVHWKRVKIHFWKLEARGKFHLKIILSERTLDKTLFIAFKFDFLLKSSTSQKLNLDDLFFQLFDLLFSISILKVENLWVCEVFFLVTQLKVL